MLSFKQPLLKVEPLPLLSVIVVNYRTPVLTIQTIESIATELLNQREMISERDLEVIVVDNYSNDEKKVAPEGQSVEQLRGLEKKYRWLRVGLANKNAGFAAGNEVGWKMARGKIIMLLNSDTLILPGSLAKLMEILKDEKKVVWHKFAILACQLRNSGQKMLLQNQGGDLPNLGRVLVQMWGLDDLPIVGGMLSSTQKKLPVFTKKKITPSGWVGGTAMLMPRELIEKVGFLDKKIFMYGEDMEFCLRVSKLWQKMKKDGLASTNPDEVNYWQKIPLDVERVCGIVNVAPIIHYGSASSSSGRAIVGEIEGYLYIWQKHFPAWQMSFLKVILSVGVMGRWLVYSLWPKKRGLAKYYAEANRKIWRRKKK